MSGSDSLSREERRAFLQKRVASFGAMGGAIGLVGFLLRPVVLVLNGRFSDFALHPVVGLNLLSFAGLGAAWLILRRGYYTQRQIAAVEYGALITTCVGFVGIGLVVPMAAEPAVLMAAGMGLVLMLRAIYVPSTVRRTVLLGAVAAPVLIGASYYIYLDTEFRLLADDDVFTSGHEAAMLKATMTAVWWAFFMATSAAASHVIFGLRAQIRDIRRLGQYTLETKIGEGGMGSVYQASHAMLRRPAAVKLLPPHKVGEGGLARFEREVQLTARLTHANTVTVYDYGRTPEGIFYYVMELLDGVTLSQVVEADGPQPESRVIHILTQAASSLAEAHSVGLIHRDIKPANIMVCRQGGVPDVVKVVDFGLVKELDSDISASMSRGDLVLGTPQYMAPEAIRRPDSVDPRADLYGLGAVGYFLVTGTHVFSGSAIEVCGHHLHSAPEPPSSRLGKPVSGELENLLVRCLAKDPADRPATAGEVVAALEELARHGAARWTVADAEAWWRAHAARCPRPEVVATAKPGATLAVDLALK